MRKHIFMRWFSFSLAVLLAVAILPTARAADETHITILGTSDLHASIWGYSYEDLQETTNNGMARLYTYIQQVRKENPNTFLIDAGDDIEGTIMVNQIYNKLPDELHPVIAAMNFMGFDSMTLGNHEFNYGIPNMLKFMGQAEFPVLAANVLNAEGKPVTGLGWTIVERGGVKLAVIGVTSPNVPVWDGGKDGIEDCTYEPVSTAVKRAIAEIGSQADLIMVSAHVGMVSEFGDENGADAGQQILDDNPEVDILQVAHVHTTVNDKQGDVLIGGVRNAAREIARFDLTLDASGKITDSKLTIVDMEDFEPSQEIREIPAVAEAHEKTVALIKGEDGAALGVTSARFQPENEIKGLPEGKLRDTAVMDLINNIQLEASGADVSAAALFKDTSDLPEGNINYGNIFDIYKFDNTLYRVTVTGAELKGYMEWSASHYNQWQPGDINISFNPEVPGYLYDMFQGVDYEIDLSKPTGQRIQNVVFKGKPLADDQTLTLAVNNYRYSSGLKAQNLVAGTKEWESSEPIRDMIVNYFAEHPVVEPTVDNNWKITGVDLQKDNPERAGIIQKINSGEIETPYAKSYNINPVAGNVVIGRKGGDVSTVDGADGVTYYRLREIAQLLTGTDAAFDVTWSRENGIEIVKGSGYSAVTAPAAGETAASTAAVTVDGKTVEVAVMVRGGSNYVSAEGLTALLGVEAKEAGGVLTLSVPVSTGVGG
ncbi:MAG: 5'-nucleotidase C-terminal domain-containing protein [Oscillospiraceae bacterium]|nr:5'-nucleotidase C-terminal domain-containing protein [Oscillospiraceae bacterium]